MPSFRQLIEAGIRWDTAGDSVRAVRDFSAALAAAAGHAERAEAACRLSHAHRRLCEWDAAVQYARDSRDAAQEARLAAREAEAINAEATVYLTRGEFAQAAALFRSILDICSDSRIRAVALLNLGGVRAQQGELTAAEADFREAYRLFALLGDVRGEALALNSAGLAALDQDRIDHAHVILEDALGRARASMDVDTIALVTVNLANVLLRMGHLEKAAEFVTEALGGFRSAGNRFRELECLRLLGDIARAAGQHAMADRHYRRGAAVAEEIGASHELAFLRERLVRTNAGSGDAAGQGAR